MPPGRRQPSLSGLWLIAGQHTAILHGQPGALGDRGQLTTIGLLPLVTLEDDGLLWVPSRKLISLLHLSALGGREPSAFWLGKQEKISNFLCRP